MNILKKHIVDNVGIANMFATIDNQDDAIEVFRRFWKKVSESKEAEEIKKAFYALNELMFSNPDSDMVPAYFNSLWHAVVNSDNNGRQGPHLSVEFYMLCNYIKAS